MLSKLGTWLAVASLAVVALGGVGTLLTNGAFGRLAALVVLVLVVVVLVAASALGLGTTGRRRTPYW